MTARGAVGPDPRVLLTAGAGINSAERGVHVPRGVPGEWPLFARTR